MPRMLPAPSTLTSTLLATAALFVLAATATAGGINLAWNDCSVGGTLSKTFACNSNTLSGAVLVASAVAPVPLDQLNGEESVFRVQTTAAALSPWWQLQSGGCRGTASVSVSFDFTGGPFNCLDPWSGQAAGGMNYEFGYYNARTSRLRTIGAIPGTTSITDADEYYFFKITLLGQKTVGTGSCAGCTDPMCILFDSIKLTQPLGVGDYTINQPLVHQYALIQLNDITACLPVPTRTGTWGSVKALYR